MDRIAYLKQIDKNVANITKDVDTKKMWKDIRIKNNISKEKWAKMDYNERLAVAIPKGIWQEEEQDEEN